MAALRESRCLNPHPEQVTDPAFLAERVLRRPRRGAGQVRDGAPRHAWTARRSPRRPRRSGTPGRRTTRQPPHWPASGLDGLVPARPGPRGGHKLTERDPRLGRGAAGRRSAAEARRPGRPHRGGIRRARAPPLRRAGAGPPPGAPQKPLTHPPATADRRTARPCPCDLHLATRLLNRTAPARMPARHSAPGGGLDARYEQLRHAALHARADRVPARARRAHRQGRHRLAACPGRPDLRSRPAGQACPPQPARRRRRLPGPVAAELVTSWPPSRRAGRHLIDPDTARPGGRSAPCSPIPRRRR